MAKKVSPDQPDMFYEPVYPTRHASQGIDCTGFANRLSRGMSRALRECGKSRHEVAASMGEALGVDTISKATIDSYTSEAKEDHQISVLRLKAFVRATRAYWLWDLVVADDGLTMLEGDEARLAEIALVEQKKAEIDAQLRQLKAKPVHTRRRRAT